MKILLDMAISLIIYFILFVFVFTKPLSVGYISDALDKKSAYAISQQQRDKIIIIAGSNGLYSHRCETIEQVLNRPCVNYSVHGSIELDIMFTTAKKHLSNGDIVVLPLEYSFYNRSRNSVKRSSLSNVYMAQHARGMWMGLAPDRLLYSFFSFDITYPITSIVENLRVFLFNTSSLTLNRQGDMIEHTRQKGIPYRNHISTLPQIMPNTAIRTRSSQAYSVEQLKRFIKYCNENGIKVIGSLPTIFNDIPLDDDTIDVIENIYKSSNAYFVELPNRSQYDRRLFYDSVYHLNEEAQIEHSRDLALSIKQLLD